MASSDDGVEVESDEGVAPEVAAAEITGAQPLATEDSPGKDSKEKQEGVEAAAAAEEQVWRRSPAALTLTLTLTLTPHPQP